MSGPVGDGLDGAGFPIRPAKHLWEVEHDYYCTERNYFANDERDLGDSHKSWQDFVAEWGESDSIDLDYNLLFRWDWVATGDLSPDLIASISLGGFHEVARVVPVGDKIHAIHTQPNRVSILEPTQRLDLLRPDDLPYYLQEKSDG